MSHSRTPRRHTSFESLFLDLRYALRTLLRDRAYTLTAVGTLALALALNVAVHVDASDAVPRLSARGAQRPARLRAGARRGRLLRGLRELRRLAQ
jgi:hypothetical protein